MAKVIDAILYFNEVELFCARYALLKEHVDIFCVFESGRTFTGLKKSNSFWTDLKAYGFDGDMNRIRYSYVDEIPDSVQASSSEDYKIELNMVSQLGYNLGEQWFKEHMSRELLKRTFTEEASDAIVLISDADEIPLPASVEQAVKMLEKNPGCIVSFEMVDYVGSIACNTGKVWEGTFALTKCLAVANCLSAVRTLSASNGRRLDARTISIPNAGWHLSSFGGSVVVEKKIRAWGHQELNRWDIRFFLRSNIELGCDIFGRDIRLNAVAMSHYGRGGHPGMYFKNGSRHMEYINGGVKPKIKDHFFRAIFIGIQVVRRILLKIKILNE